jgi:transcriptional regulator GlxA family with amidase domain
VALPRSKYAFLTLPRYSMIALSNAVEPLRMANIITGQAVYQWSIASLDGQPTPASNGLQLSPTVELEQVGAVDILFVCGGVNVREAVSPKILSALRRLAERRIPLGALCTGGYALAKAGLLDKYRATIHWENLSALREEFPRIQLSDQLFSIDRDRFTCSGGVAPLDQIASATGLSRRQIERLFKRHLNCVPKRYYLQLRLRRARELLLQTSMPIIDITTACGFQSPPHFSRCYRAQFGCPPSAERQQHQSKSPVPGAQTVTSVA